MGYSDHQGNMGPCPSGHSSEFCRGWDDAAGSSSSSSSSSTSTSDGNNCTSEGCNGEFTCTNPNQPAGVPGCPNDPSTQQHHTPEYLNGYKTGQIDGRTGIYDPGSFGAGMTQIQIQRWLQGYKDGYKSICGNLNGRMNPPCSSPPT